MAATKLEIQGWLDKLYAEDHLTHMLVVCDTYDWSDYPVYVTNEQDVRAVVDAHKDLNMQKVMEVYSRTYSVEDQLAEYRAFHYD